MTSKRKNRLFLLLLALASLPLLGAAGNGGGVGTNGAAPPRRVHRVLFLGNSLTEANQLPLIVEALAKSAGDDLEVASVTQGGANLEDLWAQGAALAAIERGGWTVVVLQQGPSSLPESQVHLSTWAVNFAERIREAGARPALYMVWPPKDRLAFFDDVSHSYTQAALDAQGALFPAGEAWRAAWRRDPSAPLYASDDFHPSAAGSYAAALSIYGVLYRKPLRGLPASLRLRDGSRVDLSPSLAALLQEAATEANRRFGRK